MSAYNKLDNGGMTMKKIALLLCVLFLALSASYGLAETGDGTMKGSEGKSGGMMTGHKGTMEDDKMINDEMKDHMIAMMKHMSRIMDKMSDMIKTMPNQKMPKMQKIMDEASAQMRDLSKMIKGKAGKKEMTMMQKRKDNMDKMMHEMETQ